MKKLFTLLSLFLCFASGAWAINTNGAMNGVFSVSSTKKVVFSQGNLQYQASTNTWRFATNQYDYIGSANANISDSYTGWIDLFGWATNGLEANTATGKMPYYTGTTNEDYGPSITSGEFDKTIYDWGKAIDDSWHTLSNAEWNYIFTGRANYSSLYGFGRLFGVNGVFLLPDDWSWSETSIATAATAAGFAWSGGAKIFSSNIISNNTLWSVMESAGAVFIPAAGYRQGTTTNMSGNGGDYWSSTASSATNAYRTSFYDEHLNLSNNYGRSDGISVRLVKDYQLQQDGEGYYLLGTAQDWKEFAGIVNNTNPAANAKMTADIDLGDDQTHIGDNNDLSYAYRGVFDGQGHKLNVNYYSSSSSTAVEGGYSIAPFRNINGATIKNLAVTGNITGYMHCAGVVGYAVSPSTNLINNVTVSANITILNTHGGGFIGHNANATTTIQDCLFNGTINGKSGGSTVGVFFGWSGSATMSLINCLENGSYTNCSTFTPTSCPGYAVPTVTNCYYAVTGSYPGTQATSAQLADGTIATALQNNRGDLVWGQRIGTDTHPVLTNDESYRVYMSKSGGYTNDPSQALSSSLCSFSISSTKKVVFSKGNLQYVGSTWQFAENQWDYFGASQTSSQKDLFEYGDYSFPEDNVAWFIMSQPEWEYLYTQRSVTNTLSAGARFIKATIGGAYRGVIIFPDYYVHPDGVDFTGTLFNHTGSDNYTATVSMDGWGKMEEAGAIFLPAAGYGTKGSSYGNSALYNSTTTFENMRYTPGFYVEEAAFDDWSYQSTGVPVRLVADAITYTVPSSGIGTFSANTAVVLPEGLEAYVCKTYDSGKSTISTQKVEGTIPANTGVLMKGKGGETYILTASSQTPEAIEGNALIAVVEATHVDQIVGEYTNFMMSGGKFVKIAASSNPDDKMPANRAYLPILTSALPTGSGQSITVNWDEETGVKAVRNAQFMVHSYYTLDGRKLNGAPSKGGVYINNGKKVIK